MTRTSCPWCKGHYEDDVDPATLCRGHEAEYEGLSLAELDRRDSEWAAEAWDAAH